MINPFLLYFFMKNDIEILFHLSHLIKGLHQRQTVINVFLDSTNSNDCGIPLEKTLQ